MTSGELLKWFESEGSSYEWTNDDIDTIKKNLKKIQDDKGRSDRDKQIYGAIDGIKTRKSFGDYFKDRSSNLSKWVDRDNAKYKDLIIEKLQDIHNKVLKSKKRIEGLDELPDENDLPSLDDEYKVADELRKKISNEVKKIREVRIGLEAQLRDRDEGFREVIDMIESGEIRNKGDITKRVYSFQFTSSQKNDLLDRLERKKSKND